MIVELAGDLLARTEQEITTHEAELERLRQLRTSLSAFIDQPEQGSRRADPVRVGSPAPASTPTSPRSGAAPADRGSDPAGEETPAAGGLGDGPASPAAASSKRRPARPMRVSCPDCDAEVRPGGLGPHRRFKHSHAATPKPRPVAVKNPRSSPPLDLPPRLDRVVGE